MADPKTKKRRKKKRDSDTGGSSGSPAGGYDAGPKRKIKKKPSADSGGPISERGAKPVKDIENSSPAQKKEALDNVNDAMQKARSLPKKEVKKVVSAMEALRRILVSASGGDAGDNSGTEDGKDGSAKKDGQPAKSGGDKSIDSKELAKATADFNRAAETLNQKIENMPEVADTLSKSPDKLEKEEIEKAIDSIDKDIEKARYIPAGAGPLTKLAYILREALRSMAGQGAAYEDKEYKKALEDYKSEFARLKPQMDRSAPPDKMKTRETSSGSSDSGGANDPGSGDKARPVGNLKEASGAAKQDALDDIENAIDKLKTLPKEEAKKLVSPMEALRRVLLSAMGEDVADGENSQEEDNPSNQAKDGQSSKSETSPDPDDMDRRVAQYNDAVDRLNQKLDDMPEAAKILAKDPANMTQQDYEKALDEVEKDIQKARYIPAGASLLVKLAYILREAIRSMAGQGGAYEDIDYKKALDDYKKAYSELKPLIDEHAPPDDARKKSASDNPKKSAASQLKPIENLKNSSPEERRQALDTVQGAMDKAEKSGGEKGKKAVSLMEALRRILLSAQGKDFDDDDELEEAVENFNEGLEQLKEIETGQTTGKANQDETPE